MSLQKTKLHFDNCFGGCPWELDLIRLFQIGECYARTGFETSEHTQWCDEITYIISGEAQITMNGVEYPARAGDLFFNPKDSIHQIVSSEENPVRYFYLGYQLIDSHHQYERWKSVDRFLAQLPCPVCHNVFTMTHLFSDLLAEFQQSFCERDKLIELSLLQIILYTYKYFSCGKQKPAIYENRIPDKQELVYKITNYIDNNVSRIRSLTDVSDYIGFSYSYTSQIFSNVMGMSLKTYYQNKRFDEAAKLLQSGLSVTQISEILGFDSIHSFSRAFKTQFGTSPQNYLKQQRKTVAELT